MSDNKEKLPIVFVQLGKLPRHLKRNLYSFVSRFPHRTCYLVTDQKENLRIPDNVLVVDSKDLIDVWPEQFQIQDRRRFFRNNFWFSSKARLLLIPRLMEKFNLGKIIHIESDVWICPSFPFQVFENLVTPLAFPLVDEVRGIASILFVNGSDGINLLDRSCAEWPHMTDMEILGQIAMSSDSELALPSTYDGNGLADLGFEKWIFDGAKLGMYLFGSDPRNSWGLSYRFKKSLMGKLDSNQKIVIDKDQLILSEGNSRKQIANLHLHSKSTVLFSKHWRLFMRFQLFKNSMGMNYGFSIAGLQKASLEFVVRVIRKIAWR